nr:retrovirus-related Pol polyprotein from transposon TNT 1-94 [Tanacetum cinerariifolium]
FESSEKVSSESENQSENDCLVVEKECDKEENPKVIASEMFKLNVSQCVSPISMSKSSCESNNVEIKLKRKRHTFSSVRIPKYSTVVWKKKGSSNTSNGLEFAFRKSTCFVRNEDGVDLLTGDRSSNLYTIALNEVASNSSNYLLAKASSSQSWLWHQRLSHLNFATINNLVKNNLVQGLPKMKFEKDHLCSACEQGKIHQKHHKSKSASASNKPLYLLHMDLCGPMRIQSINGKRYVLVVVDDYSWYT